MGIRCASILARHALKFGSHFVAYKVQQTHDFVAE
jgi:hypothetical protein